MKMKYGMSLAALLLLGSASPSMAADATALPSGSTMGVQTESLYDVAAWLPSGESKAFLPHRTWTKKLSYQALSLPMVPPDHQYAGVLTIHQKKADIAALAVGVEMKGKEAEKTFGGMFLPGGYTQEAGKKMLSFNMALMNSENILNDIFLKTTSSTRIVTGQLLPYDLLAVDTKHVEQLHKVKSMKDTYAFSVRSLVMADGYMLPLYIRGVAAKRDGAYRFLMLTGWDNSREVIDGAAFEIMK